MHYPSYVLYEPESSNYGSYYLNWFDNSYSSAGPCGEPLQYHQGEMLDESNFSVHKETEDGFLSGFSWYSDDQVYDQIQLPYSYKGGGHWLDEYESYFAGCWGEDMVRHGYRNTFYEPYNGSLEKADPDGSYYSFNEDAKQTHSDHQWPGFDFGLADGADENHLDNAWKEPQLAYDDHWSETRLWESIFGHWPCLVHIDQESNAALIH